MIYKNDSKEMLTVNEMKLKCQFRVALGDVPALSKTVIMAVYDHKLILT